MVSKMVTPFFYRATITFVELGEALKEFRRHLPLGMFNLFVFGQAYDCCEKVMRKEIINSTENSGGVRFDMTVRLVMYEDDVPDSLSIYVAVTNKPRSTEQVYFRSAANRM